MANKRSVTPDGDAVRGIRLGKRMQIDELAKKAKCSERTIENVERGQAVYANTLLAIARALDVDYNALLAKPKPETKPREDDMERTKACIVVATQGSRHVLTRQVMEQLRMLVPLRDEVVLGTTESGEMVIAPDGGLSINMTLTKRDARSLFFRFKAGELKDIDIRMFTASDCWLWAFKPPPVEPD